MKDFFAAIDTPGGHILICIFLILIGSAMAKFEPTMQRHADQLVAGAMAGIFFAMKGQNGGRVTVSDPRANPVQPAVQDPPKP